MAIAALLGTSTADWSDEALEATWSSGAALRLLPDASTSSGCGESGHGESGHRESGHGESSASGRPAWTPLRAIAEPTAVATRTAAFHDAHGGVDVTRRRARRAVVQRRRRAVVLTAVAAGLVCGLALPLSALGGAPALQHAALGGAPAPQHAFAAAPGETVYVVRPGDTLWSIASRFDRGGDPRPLAEALAQETGSAVVVPGERITIP